MPGFEARDLGVAAATGNLATAHVVRRAPAAAASQQDPSPQARHDALLFSLVLGGSARLHGSGSGIERVAAGDAFTIPPGHVHSLRECSADLELLELAIDPRRS
jgi:mannose-6-phosphate isomerase-like protein (cupin superfamily)